MRDNSSNGRVDCGLGRVASNHFINISHNSSSLLTLRSSRSIASFIMSCVMSRRWDVFVTPTKFFRKKSIHLCPRLETPTSWATCQYWTHVLISSESSMNCAHIRFKSSSWTSATKRRVVETVLLSNSISPVYRWCSTFRKSSGIHCRVCIPRPLVVFLERSVAWRKATAELGSTCDTWMYSVQRVSLRHCTRLGCHRDWI